MKDMKTYILFFIVFILSFSAYSQTGAGMRRGGQSGSGRAAGTQNIGSEGQRRGTSDTQRPSEGKSGKKHTGERTQGGNCNPAGRSPGVDAGGTSATGSRKGTGIGTKISQPNVRTNIRVNTGVRSF